MMLMRPYSASSSHELFPHSTAFARARVRVCCCLSAPSLNDADLHNDWLTAASAAARTTTM